jgi:hypothetical protein
MKYLLCLIIFILLFSYTTFEHFNYECQDNPNRLPKVIKHVFKEDGWKHNNVDWKYFFPREYTKCEKNIRELKGDVNNKNIFMIDGCDNVNSKVRLWNSLINMFTRNKAKRIMPDTYLLNNSSQIELFKKHYLNLKRQDPHCKFIMKNYKQRQLGIKMTGNLNEIVNGYNEGFYLVQDYYKDPFLIDKRKVNFRRYILIVCKNGNVEGYLHQNGFVYYTPKYYNYKSTDIQRHITSGYVNREIYENNPLTIEDFNNYLKDNGYNKKMWEKKVENLFTDVMKALKTKVCTNKKYKNSVLFQLFGADIAPNKDLVPLLMEINKGPDISTKDERDRNVKIKVIKDVISVIENKESNFIKIF